MKTALAVLGLTASLAAQTGEPPVRAEYRERFDGRKALRDRKVAAAIERGLAWLAAHQDADGRWNADGFARHDAADSKCDGAGLAPYDVGVTGLALLAFLGDGQTTKRGEYRDQVARATAWLGKQQQPTSGLFGTTAANDFIYSHAVATLAMVEAFGLSGDPQLQGFAQHGVVYLDAHRNPDVVWRYQPRDNDNDSSVTAWCTTAYESARRFGLHTDDRTLLLAATWFDRVTDDDGRVGYTKRGEGSARRAGDHGKRFPVEFTEALTAAGLSCRLMLGQRLEDDQRLQAAVDRIEDRPPVWDDSHRAVDFYYWYYASHALHEVGGDAWSKWSKQLQPLLVARQRNEPGYDGSWDPVGAWCKEGGRLYATAMSLLCLEAEYRLLNDPTADIPDRPPFATLRRNWLAGNFGAVDRELQRLRGEEGDDGQRRDLDRVAAQLQRSIARAEATVAAADSPADWLQAREQLQRVASAFHGLAVGEAASHQLDHFRRDPQARREISAAVALASIRKRLEAAQGKARERLLGQLARLIQTYDGTKAAQQAKALHESRQP